MSVNATVAEIAAALQAAVPNLAYNQARAMIKANNIRSLTKATTVGAQFASKTAEELAKEFGEATADAAPAATAPKAKAKAAPKAKAAGAAKEKTPRAPRKAATVVQAGPRGFRFGEVWTQSVKDGAGVAMLMQNRPKLNAHAETLGITGAGELSTEDLVKKMAKKL